jgi:hypothetical protein
MDLLGGADRVQTQHKNGESGPTHGHVILHGRGKNNTHHGGAETRRKAKPLGDVWEPATGQAKERVRSRTRRLPRMNADTRGYEQFVHRGGAEENEHGNVF